MERNMYKKMILGVFVSALMSVCIYSHETYAAQGLQNDPDYIIVINSASPSEIKSAYKRLAMKYHPDRLGGDQDKFKAVGTACTRKTGSEKCEVGAGLVQSEAEKQKQINLNEELLDAVRRNDLNLVKIALVKTADVNAKSKQGKTALMYAIEAGYVVIAKKLIERGADVTLKDSQGRAALWYAQNYDYYNPAARASSTSARNIMINLVTCMQEKKNFVVCNIPKN